MDRSIDQQDQSNEGKEKTGTWMMMMVMKEQASFFFFFLSE